MNFASRARGPGPAARPNGPTPSSPVRALFAPWEKRDETGAGRIEFRPSSELESAFIPLVGVMARASRRILHDETLVDDAIQETLLAYWVRPERPENPRAWLLHAVTLRSLQLARSRRRRQYHERRACLGRTELSSPDDSTRSLDHADLVRVLDESLVRVPAEYRAVFRLWIFEGMDYAGIAEALQVPIGTVRSRLNRTRKAIRESLANQYDDQRPGRTTLDAI